MADVVAVRFSIEPGGYFGWHRHGGPVWVVVNQGTLTLHDPDEPNCTKTYGPGSAFFEVGDHVHNALNEGDVDVVVVGTFLLPDGAPPRIDAADPGVCP
ncbi:MAG TPA: cupin domain-containing protein [Vicinamibacterales bacterium]|nr:cupin domain-containing protein [Vicinamibacterales bacterium]